MTDYTINDLAAAGPLAGTDLFEAWQGANPSKKASVDALVKYALTSEFGTPLNYSVGVVVAGGGGFTALIGIETGNVVEVGDTGVTLQVGAGNLAIQGIPTADPHSVGAVWSNAGVLTLSAG